MPATDTTSPTLNGRRKTRNTPAAKLASRPPQGDADRHAARRKNGRERRRFDTEEAQNRDDERDVEQHRQARLPVPVHRGVDALSSQRAAQHPHRKAYQPSPDQPEEDGTGDLHAVQRRHSRLNHGVHVHAPDSRKRRTARLADSASDHFDDEPLIVHRSPHRRNA
jgi:hypothetical protein